MKLEDERKQIEGGRRRSRPEVERLVAEYEASRLGRNEFCEARTVVINAEPCSAFGQRCNGFGPGVATSRAVGKLFGVLRYGRTAPKPNAMAKEVFCLVSVV